MKLRFRQVAWIPLIAALVLVPGREAGAAADVSKESVKEEQRQLIQVLNSNAAPAEKALACKQLVIYGTKDAVPALARLLADNQLASWARIGLESIPGSAPDKALRKAMGSLHGKLLVGTINSIAVRRDPKAVSRLEKRLSDDDTEVGSAAAIALGRIGGAKAEKALEHALASAAPVVRPAVAQGCILCAENFYNQSKLAEAVKIYDAVRSAAVPKQLILEATRGAILARKSAGLPLLLEQLRSPDKAFWGIGLRTAREMPGVEVSQALAAELNRCEPGRQAPLLLALADRGDSAASAAVVEAAKTGATKLRVVAIGALERQGNISSVPVLLEAATNGDAEVAQAALGALTRLPGNDVNADLLARLPKSRGKTRQVIIELAGPRRIHQALPAIVASVEDADAGVRAAAVQAIGVLGDDQQSAALVRLLQHTQNPKERTDIQTALTSIAAHTGARCVPHLLPLAQDSDGALRLIALPVLASAGGPDALAAVKVAVQDKDEAVGDEAVRTLSTWPNNWPEDSSVLEPLLALAKDSAKTSYQVLALRGYLHFLEGDKQLKDAEKAGKLGEVIPLIQRSEEQQLAIGIIGTIRTAEALDLLTRLAAQPTAAEDVCAAMLKLANDQASVISKEQRQHALQTILEKSKDDATRKKAEELLKGLQPEQTRAER